MDQCLGHIRRPSLAILSHPYRHAPGGRCKTIVSYYGTSLKFNSNLPEESICHAYSYLYCQQNLYTMSGSKPRLRFESGFLQPTFNR